jgi:hypothetical protein
VSAATDNGISAMPKHQHLIIPTERIERAIIFVRDLKVMLDSDLAALYGVTTGQHNQAVKRNLERFPPDFMFKLTIEEAKVIYEAISSSQRSRSQSVILKRGQNIKYRPYAFTEQGVAMLSSVLRSSRAVEVNIEIMRAFVRLRQLLASHADLARKLDELERKYDKQFAIVFEAIRKLMEPPQPVIKEMGYHTLIPQADRKPKSRRRVSSAAIR